MRGEVPAAGRKALGRDRYKSGLRDRPTDRQWSCTLTLYPGAEHALALAYQLAAEGLEQASPASVDVLDPSPPQPVSVASSADVRARLTVRTAVDGSGGLSLSSHLMLADGTRDPRPVLVLWRILGVPAACRFLRRRRGTVDNGRQVAGESVIAQNAMCRLLHHC